MRKPPFEKFVHAGMAAQAAVAALDIKWTYDEPDRAHSEPA